METRLVNDKKHEPKNTWSLVGVLVIGKDHTDKMIDIHIIFKINFIS